MEKTALEKHRETWKGKSDEWLFERLNNELKSKVEEIHLLLNENKNLTNELALKDLDIERYKKILSQPDWNELEYINGLETKIEKLTEQLAEKEKEIKILRNERDFNFKEFCRIKDLYYESQGIINNQ